MRRGLDLRWINIALQKAKHGVNDHPDSGISCNLFFSNGLTLNLQDLGHTEHLIVRKAKHEVIDQHIG